MAEQEFVFGDEGFGDDFNGDEFDVDIDNLEEMDMDEIDARDGVEDFLDDGEKLDDINMGAEWREFSNDAESRKKSRVGQAREADIEEDFNTMIGGNGKLAKIQERIDRQNKSPEDIFKTLVRRTIGKYNLPKGVENDAIRVMQNINKQNRKLKFKSPQAIVFALLVFNEKREIDKKELHKVHKDMAEQEKITLFDLLRYAFFVRELLYNK